MAQRVGLRLSPLSGSCEIVLPLYDGAGFGFVAPTTITKPGTTINFGADTLLDNGSSSYEYHSINFGLVLGLKKTVTSSSPWTIWFDAPPVGVYTGLDSAVYTLNAPDDIRLRLILETDGVESILFNGTSLNFDIGGDYSTAGWSSPISMTIQAAEQAFSDFWTDFNKTKENAPA